MAVNPNVITYEGGGEKVKLWRGVAISLDSVIATGKNIYIYSTPGRNAPVLLKMLQDAALVNNIQLKTDTVYLNTKINSMIICSHGLNTFSTWKTNSVLIHDRKSKIEKYIFAIKNSPEWLNEVKKKSIKRNIPLDSMILLDAGWMVDNEK